MRKDDPCRRLRAAEWRKLGIDEVELVGYDTGGQAGKASQGITAIGSW